MLLLTALLLTGTTLGERPMPTTTIDAHHGTHSSLVAAITGVLRSWNRDVDYARVAGLSGLAFSPVHDTGEDCRAWWMEGGDDIRLEFLGRALGFAVETVRVPDPYDDGTPHARVEDMPGPRADHFRALKAAVERGDAVLLPTWPSWSVLTGWSDDLSQLPLVTVPGFEDLVRRAWGPERTGLAHVLSPTEPTLSEADAIREAIAFGATVADGSFTGKARFRYGGALYRAAADRLDHDPFCEPCGDASWSCAIRTLHRMAGTAGSAADFLEHAGMTAAATPYRAIQESASAYSGKQLEEGWNDPQFIDRLRQAFRRFHDLHGEAAAALSESR